jgi:AbrB family looped-hinge helix DNA binding protein
MKQIEIVRISKKGQIYIPKSYRKQLGMKDGTRVGISIQGSKAILNVLPEEPLDAGCGFLSRKEVSLAGEVLKDRRAEKKE